MWLYGPGHCQVSLPRHQRWCTYLLVQKRLLVFSHQHRGSNHTVMLCEASWLQNVRSGLPDAQMASDHELICNHLRGFITLKCKL